VCSIPLNTIVGSGVSKITKNNIINLLKGSIPILMFHLSIKYNRIIAETQLTISGIRILKENNLNNKASRSVYIMDDEADANSPLFIPQVSLNARFLAIAI
jgi:hypothetical protein